MRNVIIALITWGILFVLAGCSSNPKVAVAGVVTSDIRTIGEIAPNFNFTSADGKLTSFREVKKPISIMAFTSSSGDVCCRLIPELVELASRFRGESISVAQISLPTSKCPHGPGCIENCNIKDINMISLCDESRVAWRKYNQPKANTVILVDENDRIVAVENLDNLDAVAKKARSMAQEYDKEQESLYEGG